MHREVHNAGDVWAISVSVFNCSPAVAHTHATTYRWMWHAGTPLVSDKDAAVHTFFSLLSVDHSVTAICLVNTGQDEWGRGVEWGGGGGLGVVTLWVFVCWGKNQSPSCPPQIGLYFVD